VLNGDVLSGHDISAQIDLHRKADAAVTLHLVEVPDPSRFGCVPIDGDGRVTAFLEKTPNPVTNRINAGCYVFRRSVIDEIPPGQVISVERSTFPDLISAEALVMGYPDSSYWLDVGTPEAFVQGSCDLVRGRLASAAVPGPPGELLTLEGASVDPSAQVRGGTAVGAGARVGADAYVTGSVLFDAASIGAGARVSGSVIGRGTVVGEGVVLDGVVLGDEVHIAPGNELRCGMRVWPGQTLGLTCVRFSTDT
jgi:mannose-1-phosphate guanylyltransferase